MSLNSKPQSKKREFINDLSKDDPFNRTKDSTGFDKPHRIVNNNVPYEELPKHSNSRSPSIIDHRSSN